MRSHFKSFIVSIFVLITHLLCYLIADTLVPANILDMNLSTSQKQVLLSLSLSAAYFLIPIVAEVLFNGLGITRRTYEEIDSELEEKDLSDITKKMSGSVRYITTLVSISIALIILTVNFSFIQSRELGKFEKIMTHSMLTLLLIASGFLFVALETFDTGSNPWKDVEILRYLRVAGMRMYVIGLLALMFSVLLGVSIVSPYATMIGSYAYTNLLYLYILVYK